MKKNFFYKKIINSIWYKLQKLYKLVNFPSSSGIEPVSSLKNKDLFEIIFIYLIVKIIIYIYIYFNKFWIW